MIDLTIVSSVAAAFASVIGIFWPIWIYFDKKRITKRDKEWVDKFKAITTSDVQQSIKQHMLDRISNIDPDTYYTHELCFPGGQKLFIPIIPGIPLPVLENITLQFISHGPNETIISMKCEGHGHIGKHSHGVTIEEIHVMAGVMTDLQTGTMYREGDVWVISPDSEHTATFTDCVAIIILRPPLPKASERSANLEAMSTIYP